SAALDTLLYDEDPSSRTLIAYSYDNDGDPAGTVWNSASVPDVISVRLVDADFPVGRHNFNWWFTSYGQADFGPRRLGTPDDPLRLFDADNLGYPVTSGDRYYLLSHPEIDYDQIETAVHDSSDGWVPALPEQAVDFANGYDTRFLYSFGPFDLPPGDSVTFTLAIAAAERIHRQPADFTTYFDPANPQAFRDRLDIGPLMTQHRRADSVYRSGLILPILGPPQGLIVSDYESAYVRLSWWPSQRPDLAGYCLYVQGAGGQWLRTSPYLITDTTGVFYVPDQTQTYNLAVGAVDTRGRASKVSVPVSVLPGRPHPVENLEFRMDGMIPELTWTPHNDTILQAYVIYRSIWKGPFQVYDSTVNWSYRDLQVESGIQYSYKVSAKNRLGLESVPTGPVAAIPLARNKGTLFCNLNRPGQPNSGPYQNQYSLALYQSAAAVAPIDWYIAGQGPMGLKQMADYSLIVFDWEKREDGLPLGMPDSIGYYLANGGNAIFILLATQSISSTRRIYRYDSDSFFHDILKLDSAIANGYNMVNGSFIGDLAGCQPLVAEYPSLAADTVKFRPSMIPIIGFIPMAGCLFPTDEVEPLYTYISSNPDSINHGQINGIRYKGEAYQFVLFTFPLSLMKTPAAYLALKRALTDMGIDMGCGDISVDDRITVGDAVFLINYLFRGGPAPTVLNHADVDGSGVVDLADAVYTINFLFRAGPGLLCPQDQ
ncbi:MAG: dockerin type I repeat-containing protein, partial [candidate division Zixibacteria bacterium]|nr:dockerin type I repeat-containing protein [candidate division Zixibacteria bacterium]